MRSSLITIAVGIVAITLNPGVFAQVRRDASPPGTAATEVLGTYDTTAKPVPVYKGGKWIEITYGRPIKRGRDVFGSGADYGKFANSGAPVWRAGANESTQLTTEVPLSSMAKQSRPAPTRCSSI